jgi:hypothetical protein
MIKSGTEWVGGEPGAMLTPKPHTDPSVLVDHAPVHHAGYVWTRAER